MTESVPLTRLPKYVDLINGFPFRSDDFSPEGEVPLVRIRDLLEEEFSTFVPEKSVPEHARLINGDIVIGMDGDFNVRLWDRGDAALNQRLCYLRAKPSCDPRYVAYALPTQLQAINDVTPSTTVKHLSSNDVLGVKIPDYSISAQRRIADYLDRETSEIDAMIDKLGELAKQLRARANRAVDEAIFTASKHASLGYAVDCLPGYAFKSSRFSHNNADIPLLRGVNVKPDGLDWTETVYWPEELADGIDEYFLHPGDIVLGMDRPFIGSGTRVVQIENSDPKSLLVQRVLRIRALAGNSARYVYHALKSKAFEAYATPETTGISVPHISETQVRDFKIPLPPLEDQRRIADHLDDVTSKIDMMLAKVAELKALLIERRAALITDVVTGRKDVA